MIISISGTPGSGKTTVSLILSKMTGFRLIGVNDFAKEKGLIIGRDRKRKTSIVDIKRLKKESAKIKGDAIFEGHLAHFAQCDICVVLRTSPPELEKRLKKKLWNKEKIAENVEAEILDVCLVEAVEKQGADKVFEVDTTGKMPEDVALEIKGILGGKTRKEHTPGKVDWTEYPGNIA